MQFSIAYNIDSKRHDSFLKLFEKIREEKIFMRQVLIMTS